MICEFLRHCPASAEDALATSAGALNGFININPKLDRDAVEAIVGEIADKRQNELANYVDRENAKLKEELAKNAKVTRIEVHLSTQGALSPRGRECEVTS
jgi:hypothetical protein